MIHQLSAHPFPGCQISSSCFSANGINVHWMVSQKVLTDDMLVFSISFLDITIFALKHEVLSYQLSLTIWLSVQSP